MQLVVEQRGMCKICIFFLTSKYNFAVVARESIPTPAVVARWVDLGPISTCSPILAAVGSAATSFTFCEIRTKYNLVLARIHSTTI